MPISDKKKCQSLINKAAEIAEGLKVGATRLEALRSAYQTQSVDPTGTPLDGQIATVSNWIDSVRIVADAAVADAMIAAKVPTHAGNALEA